MQDGIFVPLAVVMVPVAILYQHRLVINLEKDCFNSGQKRPHSLGTAYSRLTHTSLSSRSMRQCQREPPA